MAQKGKTNFKNIAVIIPKIYQTYFKTFTLQSKNWKSNQYHFEKAVTCMKDCGIKYLKPFQPCACEGDDKTMSSEKGVGVAKEVSRVRGGGAKSVSDSSSLFDSTGGGVGVERHKGGDESTALSTLPLPPKKSRDSASADDYTEDGINKEQKGKKLQNTFVYQR